LNTSLQNRSTTSKKLTLRVVLQHCRAAEQQAGKFFAQVRQRFREQHTLLTTMLTTMQYFLSAAPGRLRTALFWCGQLLVLIATTTACQTVHAGDTPPAELTQLLKNIGAAQATPAMVQVIEKGHSVNQVVRRYTIVVSHFYGNKKDITQMQAIAATGIDYMLTAAAKEADQKKAVQLQGAAKQLAYNASANAWPGWETSGVTITRQHSQQAMKAAKLNLKLGIQLKRPPLAIGNAHWLIGAQHLALHQLAAAITEFAAAAKQFQAAGNSAYRLMAEGYAGIATAMQAPGSNAGQKQQQAAIAALTALDTSDSRFFAKQIKTVGLYFKQHSAKPAASADG